MTLKSGLEQYCFSNCLPIAENLSIDFLDVRSFYRHFSLTSWSFIFQILRGPSFSGLAFFTPVSWSRIFVLLFVVLHFRSCIFSAPCLMLLFCRSKWLYSVRCCWRCWTFSDLFAYAIAKSIQFYIAWTNDDDDLYLSRILSQPAQPTVLVQRRKLIMYPDFCPHRPTRILLCSRPP